MDISDLKGWWAIFAGMVLTVLGVALPRALGYVAKEAMEAYALYRNRATIKIADDLQSVTQELKETNQKLKDAATQRSKIYKRLERLGERVSHIEGALGLTPEPEPED